MHYPRVRTEFTEATFIYNPSLLEVDAIISTRILDTTNRLEGAVL